MVERAAGESRDSAIMAEVRWPIGPRTKTVPGVSRQPTRAAAIRVRLLLVLYLLMPLMSTQDLSVSLTSPAPNISQIASPAEEAKFLAQPY